MRRIGDAAHGMHPCDRYEMTMPSGDRAVIWVARDLEGLVVRIEHLKKDPRDEYQPVTDTQLLDVRLGAPAKLFEKPDGFTVVKTYEELGKVASPSRPDAYGRAAACSSVPKSRKRMWS